MPINPMRVKLNGFAILFKILSAHCAYARLDSSIRLKDYFKVSVIQGLRARKGLKAKGFFRNLRMHLKKKKKNAIT